MSRPASGQRYLRWPSRPSSRAPFLRCSRPNEGMRRALVIGLLAFAVPAAFAQSAVNNDLSFGRRIFSRGGAANEVTAIFAGTNTPLPPNVRRCAACHGRDGRGTREGGVEIPPVSWAALVAPRDPSAGRPGRPAYDQATLKRALA